MKFSENWLRELVNVPVNTVQLADSLTMAGLEVEEIIPVAGKFSDVVIGQILQTKAHPDADKLQICMVDDGTEHLQIVCGAPNARAGIKVPLAKVGALLPHDFLIQKTKLRGVESCGMLCSGAELQINDDKSGLLELPNVAPVGQDLRTYLELDDNCIELSITPNRGDCLSMLGLAREASAIFNLSYQKQDAQLLPAIVVHKDDVIPINVNEPAKCPRYCGRIIRNIDLSKSSPLWLTERLRRAGLRSINLAVDVTNYVMLELGQPMHAFDLAQIDGGIEVRSAKNGEQLILLDGRTIELDDDSLVIADHVKPLALAGIMGGEHSGVSLNTKDLFLESAFFTSETVANKARSLGLHTDSCYRYERGVDANLSLQALERATNLLIEYGGGEAGAVIERINIQYLPKLKQINLRLDRVTKVLGLHIEESRIEQILGKLDFSINKVEQNLWQITVPSYRFDISLEIDLIEEIARLYGYANIEAKPTKLSLSPKVAFESKVGINQIKNALIGREYQEIISYSFIAHDLAKVFAPNIEPISLVNPISQEMAVMRSSLLPSLFKVAQYNLKRQHSRIKLFETGLRFTGSLDNLVQTDVVAGIVIGSKHAESWMNTKEKFDFYAIKSDVELLLGLGGLEHEYRFIRSNHYALHPGQSAQVIKNGKEVGYVGVIHPKLAKTLDINQQALVFELNLADVCAGTLAKFKGLSKFPVIRRDLALVVAQNVEYQDLFDVIKQQAGNNLVDVCLFDVYQGENIAKDQRSLAIGLTFQHQEKTLTDKEISDILSNIVAVCADRFNSYLRT